MAAARRPPPTGTPGRDSFAGDRLRGWAVLALILGAAAAVQISAVLLPFFSDDYLFLDQVRFRSLPAALLSPDPLGNFVRPVGRQLWFWGLSRLGESPVLAHALNLGLFLGILALLFGITRRLAGIRAAAIAAGVIALHYAADVPVRWVSGCQDLLATLGALGAIALFLNGRGRLACASLALALLSKETVALTPLIAAFAGWRKDEPWAAALRRAWPLGLVTAAWAIVWLARMGHGSAGAVGISSLPAAFVHLGQVLVGAEWRPDDAGALLHTVPPLLAIGLVVVAVALTRPGRAEAQRSRKASKPAARTKNAPAKKAPAPRSQPSGTWSPAWTGLLWALAGAIPVIAVAPIWSAYFYLFALCGVALTMGAWLKRVPVLVAVLVVALLGWSSENARRLQEFETSPSVWSVESHVNRFYLDRALGRLGRYVADLKRQRPELPHRSTLYFAGVPSFVGLQAADGPLVRWAYHDSSLRSYYATEFGATSRRGPSYVFQVQNDSLQEITDKPGLLRGMAVSAIMDDKLDLARSILQTDLVQHPADQVSSYLLAWVDLPQQPAAHRDEWLRAHGVNPVGPPTAEVAAARARLAAGDMAGATRLATVAASAHGLDPEGHALLADLIYEAAPDNYTAVIEAFATRVLTPDDPAAWRRWAIILGYLRRYRTGLIAMRRYFELGGAVARQDQPALKVLDFLERAQPGGDLTQRGLRREMDRK